MDLEDLREAIEDMALAAGLRHRRAQEEGRQREAEDAQLEMDTLFRVLSLLANTPDEDFIDDAL